MKTIIILFCITTLYAKETSVKISTKLLLIKPTTIIVTNIGEVKVYTEDVDVKNNVVEIDKRKIGDKVKVVKIRFK